MKNIRSGLSRAGSSIQRGAWATVPPPEADIWLTCFFVWSVGPERTIVALRGSVSEFFDTVIPTCHTPAAPEVWERVIQPSEAPSYSTERVQADVAATSRFWLPPSAETIAIGTFKTGMVSSSCFWQENKTIAAASPNAHWMGWNDIFID